MFFLCYSPFPLYIELTRCRYRGISEDELLNREGVSPQEYLEFTENFDEMPPPPSNDTDYYDGSDTDDQFNYFSVPGEPGLRGPPGVSGRERLKNYSFLMYGVPVVLARNLA